LKQSKNSTLKHLHDIKMNKKPIKVKRALISVSNKAGIIDFSKQLIALGVSILSTGGSARLLREQGLEVTAVADYTNFPEIMGGRVKTLHPVIAGGILGLRDQHHAEAENNNIGWIDLVVCNLYPFSETIQKHTVTEEEALENIDIGGPTMIRAAAKNQGWVGVLVDPADYNSVITELLEHKGLTFETRQSLASKAFGHTAQYDTIIHNYLKPDQLSDDLTMTFKKFYAVRYGENPHQQAAAYQLPIQTENNILTAKIHQGKKLSYNNMMDADGALACIREFNEPACVIVKHANPCGVAVGKNIEEVYQRAFDADSLSAFGGIVAMNQTCTAAVAKTITKIFVEIVLAPDYEAEALAILAKKKNVRVLEIGTIPAKKARLQFRQVEGGVLIQEADISTISADDLKIVTRKKPSIFEIDNMLFGWKVLKHVKSNAILIANNHAIAGIGPGQVSRVDAVEIAIRKAGESASGGILASDAFFPFRDSIDLIAKSGVKAIIQPGGSVRDAEVIAACNEHGLAMVFTGIRCFKH